MVLKLPTKLFLVVTMCACAHVTIAQTRSISYGNPAPTGIGLGAYQPKTFGGITAVSVDAEPPPGDDPWLSRLVGHWVLRGLIAGKDTTHDVDVEWVLNHLYIRLHEVSREKDSRGRPAYEAIVYVTWYAAAGEYAILWLDTTASGGFSPEGIGHAKPEGESLPFVFKDAHGEVSFKNTFAYNPASRTWAWVMDNVDKGVPKTFGRVKLTRR